jgi:hexulose-6-phosphate isomerase
MASITPSSRRNFLRGTLAGAIGAAAAGSFNTPALLAADGAAPAAGGLPKLKKAVKFDMVNVEGASVADRFALLKELGFEGCEINSPSDVDKEAAKAASEQTGVKIHGVIDSVHWQKRLSDPKEEVRAEGLAALLGAIKDAQLYGADTVLLVPGAVRDAQNENYQQVWDRSTAEVKKAIPAADAAGVKIAIEVVWNEFITKPEQLVEYVDQFGTPTVGAYFDVSNMIKYGVPPADWIRALGKRMLKFDFKGYSHDRKWVEIGEGDENWPEVLKALSEIGYNGWATSEVKGGGRERLKEIADRMDRVLGMKQA